MKKVCYHSVSVMLFLKSSGLASVEESKYSVEFFFSFQFVMNCGV